MRYLFFLILFISSRFLFGQGAGVQYVDTIPTHTPDVTLGHSTLVRDLQTDQLYNYDGAEWKRVPNETEIVYGIDSVQQLASMDSLVNFKLGDRIVNRSTGANYVIQTDSVAGYQTDSIAVVSVDTNYAVLQAEDGQYNVKWFGAVGDGVTNDSAAFAKASIFAGGITVFNTFPPNVTASKFVEKSKVTIKVPKGTYKVSGLKQLSSFNGEEGALIDVEGGIFIDLDDLTNPTNRVIISNLAFVNYEHIVSNWSSTFNSSIVIYLTFENCTFQDGRYIVINNKTANFYCSFNSSRIDNTGVFKGGGDGVFIDKLIGKGYDTIPGETEKTDLVNLGGPENGISSIIGGNVYIKNVMLSAGFENNPVDYDNPSSIYSWVRVEKGSTVSISNFRFGGESGGGLPILIWQDSAKTGSLEIGGGGVHISTGISPILFYGMPEYVNIEPGVHLGKNQQYGSEIFFAEGLLDSIGSLQTSYQLDDGDIDRRGRNSWSFNNKSINSKETNFLNEFYGIETSEIGVDTSITFIPGADGIRTNTNGQQTAINGPFNLSAIRFEALSDVSDSDYRRINDISVSESGFHNIYFYYKTDSGALASIHLETYDNVTLERRYPSDLIRLPLTFGQWRKVSIPFYLRNEANVTNTIVFISITEANKGQTVSFSDAFVQKGYGSLGIPKGDVEPLTPTLYSGTAAPVYGTWKEGDMVFSTQTGNRLGWICTVGGTPGTWVPTGYSGDELLLGSATDRGDYILQTDDDSLNLYNSRLLVESNTNLASIDFSYANNFNGDMVRFYEGGFGGTNSLRLRQEGSTNTFAIDALNNWDIRMQSVGGDVSLLRNNSSGDIFINPGNLAASHIVFQNYGDASKEGVATYLAGINLNDDVVSADYADVADSVFVNSTNYRQYGNEASSTDGSGDITVTFGTAFSVAPAVVIITSNDATPYIHTVTAKTTTTFTVRIYDTGGSAVTSTAMDFDWLAIR